jgi:hypothetical protein
LKRWERGRNIEKEKGEWKDRGGNEWKEKFWNGEIEWKRKRKGRKEGRGNGTTIGINEEENCEDLAKEGVRGEIGRGKMER